MVENAFNPNTVKAEVDPWVQGQPGLQSKFQNSQWFVLIAYQKEGVSKLYYICTEE